MHLTRHYIVAEYCGGEFYMGWWLYERDTNDGRRNADVWNQWGWMRGDNKAVYDLCCSMGNNDNNNVSPPKWGKHSQAFAEWFALTFPNGLRVTKDEWGNYELIEIVQFQDRPRQRRRHVVRTIRGAAACDRRHAGR